MKEKGYVYILVNPAFREDWVKIGKSKASSAVWMAAKKATGK